MTNLATTLALLSFLTPCVAAQAWVLEFQGGEARLDPGLQPTLGPDPQAILHGVADDGRGGTLGAYELVGPGTGELRLDGTPIATFAAPALDVDVTGERFAYVAAEDVWVVDLDTGVSSFVWSPSGSAEVISVAGFCGGSFYAITESFTGRELVRVDGFGVAPQATVGTMLIDVDSTWDGSSVIYASDDSAYFLGNPVPIYTAFLGLGDSLGGVAIDETGRWALSIDTGSLTLGQVVVDGAPLYSWNDQYPGDIDAIARSSSSTLRLGSPPNPPALFATPPLPALGEVWAPVIDHAFFAPNAVFDFVAVSVKDPIEVFVPGVGTLLCQPPPPSQILVAPAGQPIAVPMPPACDVGFLELCVQGGSFGGGGIVLTNALDLNVGL